MVRRITYIIVLFFTLSSMPSLAQSEEEMQKKRLEYEQKALEKLDEQIQVFLVSLPIDDFQREIIKQKLTSYYQAKKEIYMNSALKYYERDELLMKLDNSHFLDIKNIITDDTMTQIQVFIKDAGATLEKQNKKKKKKNKNK